VRCQGVTEALRKRGHEVRVLASNHGLLTEQRDAEIERRLWLNGVFGHPQITAYWDLRRLEAHNHQMLREAVAQFQPELLYVWSLHGLSKSLIFGFRHARLATAYDVADHWLARELRDDPWLRWWNQTNPPFLGKLGRALLELTGQRGSADKIAPTRLTKGLDRLPEVYGPPETMAQVEPNSIGAFQLDRLYFCSQALKDLTQLAGFRVSHAEVIRPGIATELFVGDVKPSSAPMTKFLIVTNLVPEGGVMTALEAVKKARESKVSLKLNIYGRGESDYMAQLRSFVVLHTLPVEFMTMSNLVRDLPAVYRQHDVLLHTAEWEEPFALTPLEAMASGLPVIAARTGAMKEILRHGDNAFLYTPGNSVELASRIQELQMQPALRSQVAESAQAEVISKFNESAVTDQIESYLQATLEIWQQT